MTTDPHVLTAARLDQLAALSGLIPSEVGAALADLAAEVPHDHAIVEVGSFRGKSTAHLAAGAKAGNGAKVFAVDPWDLPGNVYGKHGYSAPEVRADFEAQLRSVKVWGHVTPVQQFSTVAAAEWDHGPVGMLFVDADHEALAVLADVDAWLSHLAPGAVIALDDLDTPRNPGVRQAAEGLATTMLGAFEVIADRLAVFRVPA